MASFASYSARTFAVAARTMASRWAARASPSEPGRRLQSSHNSTPVAVSSSASESNPVRDSDDIVLFLAVKF